MIRLYTLSASSSFSQSESGNEIRALASLLICYGVGLVIIIFVGPISGGWVWLFAFAVLAGVLLGLKAAILAILFNAVTLSILAWLISSGLFGTDLPFFKSVQAMTAAFASFIVANAIAAMSVSALVKGLVSTHEKEKALSNSLEKERRGLIEAKEGP